MKLVVLACLVTVCYSQPAIHIPETFTSTLEITRTRGNHNEIGRGSWDRNAEEMEFMYRDSFKSPAGNEETFEMLGLYAKKMRYSILMTGTTPNATHCRSEKIPENDEFPKVWEWLSDPKTTHEEKTINGTTYIVYTSHGHGDETVILEVKADEPTRPVVEIRDGREGKEETRYVTFEAVTPPSTVFEVPPSCQRPPPRKHHV